MYLEISYFSRTIGWMKPRNSSLVILILTILITTLVPTQAVSADDIPSSAYIDGVTGHPQQHTLSCEARSAVDLADFWGVTFSEDQFLAKLPISDNPEKGFVGYVDDAGEYSPQFVWSTCSSCGKSAEEAGLEGSQ